MIGQMPNVERIQSTRWFNSRRSQRVILRIPVVIRGQAEGEQPWAETTHTLIVNVHGALIILATEVHPEQPLVLQNLHGGKEQRCYVVQVGKRQSDGSEIGVAFVEPSPRFWNIDFPAADWKPVD